MKKSLKRIIILALGLALACSTLLPACGSGNIIKNTESKLVIVSEDTYQANKNDIYKLTEGTDFYSKYNQNVLNVGQPYYAVYTLLIEFKQKRIYPLDGQITFSVTDDDKGKLSDSLQILGNAYSSDYSDITTGEFDYEQGRYSFSIENSSKAEKLYYVVKFTLKRDSEVSIDGEYDLRYLSKDSDFSYLSDNRSVFGSFDKRVYLDGKTVIKREVTDDYGSVSYEAVEKISDIALGEKAYVFADYVLRQEECEPTDEIIFNFTVAPLSQISCVLEECNSGNTKEEIINGSTVSSDKRTFSIKYKVPENSQKTKEVHLGFSFVFNSYDACSLRLTAECNNITVFKYSYEPQYQGVLFELGGEIIDDPEIFTYEFDEQTQSYAITGLSEIINSGWIIIPSQWNGYPVSSIAKNAFWNSSITGATISDGITEIGSGAFSTCSNLTRITIPGSVETIGTGAFSASGLEKVIIPDGVKSIGDGAFNSCKALESVTISDSVTTIGKRAFWTCSKLTEVNIGSGVEAIGEFAFYGCYNIKVQFSDSNPNFCADGSSIFNKNKTVLVSSYGAIVPDGTESISAGAYGEYDYNWIVLPESLKEIGENAFACKGNIEKLGGSYFYTGIHYIYYMGNAEQWKQVNIAYEDSSYYSRETGGSGTGSRYYYGDYNAPFRHAAVYYYSEEQPETSGNFWHYVDGIPTRW
ncbi:MAG: leucine-rich repeat domain-containing protein [Candidatus Coproplasma sp.]